MIQLIINAIIACRLASVQPDVIEPLAHVHAAQAQIGDDLSIELLLGLAAQESGLDPRAVSRVEDGKRVGGVWRHVDIPAGEGPRFCGVTQSEARHSWEACVALRDLSLAYAEGARHLRNWLKASKGNLRKALCGYNMGWAGFQNGCRGYDSAVLYRASRLSF